MAKAYALDLAATGIGLTSASSSSSVALQSL
jgi:hypothetical protein